MAKTFIVIEKSLSFDTVMTHFKTRSDAEAKMLKTLVEYGDWPRGAAVEASKKGTPVLVRDNGDDETVEIRMTEAI